MEMPDSLIEMALIAERAELAAEAHIIKNRGKR
jgi:hypothetical protein